MHVSNLFTTEPMVQVAKKLVEKTHLGGKVFFSSLMAPSFASAPEDVYKRQWLIISWNRNSNRLFNYRCTISIDSD